MAHEPGPSAPKSDELLRAGIEAAEAGDRERARDLLARAAAKDRRNPLVWLSLSEVVDDPEQAEYCLEQVLALDPGHPLAQQRLAQLRQEPAHPAPPPTPLPAAPAPAAAAAPAPTAAAFLRSEFTLIAVLGLVLLLLIALGVEGLPAPLPLLRLLLGLPFVLFIPGYALQAALFPRADDLDGPERLALSFGLSVAVVPPIALLLDWLPWGIRLWPIVVSESLVIFTFSAVALLRRHHLPPADQFRVRVQVDLRGWWAGQDRTGRILYGVLTFAFLLAAGSAIAIVVLPKSGEYFTEFYILGSEGLAESYPREVVAGQTISVTAGITNREGVPATYRIEVRLAGESIGAGDPQIGTAGPVTLPDGETWEGPIQFALPQPGDDQQIHFLLYRDAATQPYRSLHLWLNVTAP